MPTGQSGGEFRVRCQLVSLGLCLGSKGPKPTGQSWVVFRVQCPLVSLGLCLGSNAH